MIRCNRKLFGLLGAVLLLTPLTAAVADTLRVPSEYATIQAAIDASVDGDVVEIDDGTYTGTGNKDLDFVGKAITVRSASGDPALCIIDCENDGRGFYFHNAEGPDSIVLGLTITNGSASSGGGVYCRDFSSPALTNCTISGNSASNGGGGVHFIGGGPTLTNSVLWSATPTQIVVVQSDLVVAYCDVQGGWEGTGNIDADPLFVDPDGPDDDPETWQDNDYRLGPGSPCIDAADNAAVVQGIITDLDGNQRFVDDPETDDTGRGDCPVVDMGAYEFQAEDGCCLRDPRWICDGDVDGDGQVNPVDSGLVQAAFGSVDEGDLCQYDVDCDGQINPVDSGIVQSLFGTCEAPRDACP